MDWHRSIWPGVEVPEPLRGRTSPVSGSEDGVQQWFFKQQTIATSLLVSSMSWCMFSVKRHGLDRKKAVDIFRILLSKVAANAGESTLSFQLQPVGFEESMTVRTNASLLLRDVWPLDAVRRQAAQAQWDKMRLRRGDRAGPAIQSHFDTPHLVDLIMFGLDEANVVSWEYKGVALSLLSQVAALVDATAKRFTDRGQEADDSTRFKSKRRQKQNTRILNCHAAMLLWHGNKAPEDSKATCLYQNGVRAAITPY